MSPCLPGHDWGRNKKLGFFIMFSFNMEWQGKEQAKLGDKNKNNKQRVLTIKTHQFHEATPLSILKVPEGQTKLKVFQPFFGGAVRRSPPSLDGEVPCLCLKHRECVPKLEAETLCWSCKLRLI